MEDKPSIPPLSDSTVLVIGLGMIGGSLAAALKQRDACRQMLAWDRDRQSMAIALEQGIIDGGAETLASAVDAADLLVVAVPVLSIEPLLAELASLDVDWSAKVVTDVGSAKQAVVSGARKAFGYLPENFVPGHPIAGSERSGVMAANPDLYDAHKVILTPTEKSSEVAISRVTRLWTACGAEVLQMDAEHHDEVLAKTSHLPHLLAFSLVDTLAGEKDNQDIFRYAAGGFRDFTRIAASDPAMWHDVFQANRQAVLEALDAFRGGLDTLYLAVANGDSQAMRGIFTRARVAREHFTSMLENQAYLKPMTNSQLTYVAHPGGSVRGEIRVPGDKSISHRSIMLGALAQGVTEVDGFLEGEDALATLQAFRDMGVVIDGPHNGHVTIYGVGLRGLKQPTGPLYMGNAGTAMRLMAGLMACQDFDVELTGDESLSKRPMGRVVDPLRDMGAVIETGSEGRPPLVIRGGRALKGLSYDMPMASAQVKSCLLLAGLYAEGETAVTEPGITRDHTERMLRGFEYSVDIEDNRVLLQGGGVLESTNIDIPADISSAAFFMVAASIAPDSEVLLKHVGINPTRTGVIDILRLMGADITLENVQGVGGEPVADIRVRSARLKGIEIPERLVPLAIDEFPVLFVAAACADGVTVLRGAGELRVKESDRIQSMADGLRALGVNARPLTDGIEIIGGEMGGATINSHGDHRVAMAFAVAALRAKDEIIIRDCSNVATSFPNFVELADSVGFRLQVTEKIRRD